MINASRLGLGLGIATLLVLGSSSVAHAQYQAPPPGYYAPPPRYAYPPPPPPPPRRYSVYREGLVVGFALGGGGISGNCSIGYCGGAVSGEFHIGGMINPRLALMLDVWGNVRDVNGTDSSFSQTFWTAALQFWPADILWLKGGLGISHVQVSDTFGPYQDDTALGLMLAAGVEVVQIGNMALDLQFRAGFGFYDPTLNNYAFLVGLSWY
jgi:outer membrane protein with beta-barrel domain